MRKPTVKEPYTGIEVLEMLEDIARRMPDTINPIEDEKVTNPVDQICVYNKNGRHCFAGQFFYEVFGKTPPKKLNSVSVTEFFYDNETWNPKRGVHIREFFTNDAMLVLERAQRNADSVRRPWREVMALVKSHYPR